MPPYSVPFEPSCNIPTTQPSMTPSSQGDIHAADAPLCNKDPPSEEGLSTKLKEIAINEIDDVIDQVEKNGSPVPMSPVQSPAPAERNGMNEYVRKAGVAVAGGAMVGLGLVMIPLPTPCGALVAASGMGVLATEFPEAQRVLDTTKQGAKNARDKLVNSIEQSALEEEKLEQEREEKKASMLRELESKQDVVPPTVVAQKSDFSTMFMNPKEKERQSKLSNNAPPERPEDHIDNARRTIRRGASRFGQSMLPFLKKMDQMEVPVPAFFGRKPTEATTAEPNQASEETAKVEQLPSVNEAPVDPVANEPDSEEEVQGDDETKPTSTPVAQSTEIPSEATIQSGGVSKNEAGNLQKAPGTTTL